MTHTRDDEWWMRIGDHCAVGYCVGAPCLLEIEFRLSPQKRREFVQSLEFFLASGDSDPKRIRLLQDRTEPDHLLLTSNWLDLKELEDFTQVKQFRALMGGLRILSTILDCRIVTLNGSIERAP